MVVKLVLDSFKLLLKAEKLIFPVSTLTAAVKAFYKSLAP